MRMINVRKYYVPLVLLASVLYCSGCRDVRPFGRDRVVAKAGDAVLYKRDVKGIYHADMTASDSLKALEIYVNEWIVKRLKVDEAERLVEKDGQDRDIESMVEDYRNSLLSHKLDQYYIDRRLDTLFTAEDVKNYYDKHRAEFKLDRAIVKGKIIRVPNGYRQKMKLKTLLASGKPEQMKDLAGICQKNNLEFLEFDTWTDYADFLSYLPTRRGAGYESLLTRHGVQEMADNDNLYLLLISEYRTAGDEMPLERAVDAIRRIIFNQRRTEIVRRYEDSLYRAALENGQVKVHIHEPKN